MTLLTLSETAMNKIPGKILTREASGIPPLETRKSQFTSVLEKQTVDVLKELYQGFFGKPPSGKYKAKIAQEMADKLIFPSVKEFNAWFSNIPLTGQKIVWKIAFLGIVQAAALEI